MGLSSVDRHTREHGTFMNTNNKSVGCEGNAPYLEGATRLSGCRHTSWMGGVASVAAFPTRLLFGAVPGEWRGGLNMAATEN